MSLVKQLIVRALRNGRGGSGARW